MCEVSAAYNKSAAKCGSTPRESLIRLPNCQKKSCPAIGTAAASVQSSPGLETLIFLFDVSNMIPWQTMMLKCQHSGPIMVWVCLAGGHLFALANRAQNDQSHFDHGDSKHRRTNEWYDDLAMQVVPSSCRATELTIPTHRPPPLKHVYSTNSARVAAGIKGHILLLEDVESNFSSSSSSAGALQP